MGAQINPQSSGIEGLDEILHGGVVTGRMYLVRGQPGSGKTLLGCQFLEEGLSNGETVLFIHGEESRDEILANATQFGIDIDGGDFLDLGPDSDFFTEGTTYDLVDPSDVERDRYITDIYEAIEEIDPSRVVIDPITQLRYVEASDHQFRKRILSFMRFLKKRDVTVIVTSTPAGESKYDTEIQSLSDGIVDLCRDDGERRIQVAKHRGLGQADGDHGMEIGPDGMEVFPAIVPEQYERPFDPTRIESGVTELDELLGGGLEQGTVTFITGPTGAGKTTIASQFLSQTAREGTQSVVYLFEESIETFAYRAESVGIPIREMRERGSLSVETVEPLALSAEEFAGTVRKEVEAHGTDVVMIDGIDGYTVSIQGEQSTLVRKLHALTRYLKNRGVSVIVTDEIPEITGISTATSSNLSYVADNLVFLSYVELDGELRKVVGVLKKRAGNFDHELREFEITPEGIQLGESLSGVSGILGGTTVSDGAD